MRISPALRVCFFLIASFIVGCSSSSAPIDSTLGADPELPDPDQSLLPTVNIAPAIGWVDGGKPTVAEGLAVKAYATELDHPRWLYVLPNGDVLVAETNAPARPARNQGLRAWFMNKIMARAGAAVPSRNRITLLRDTNHDGVADFRSTFLEDLNSPFGMYLEGRDFYVANTDALLRFDYAANSTELTGLADRIAELPAGPLNHHWTKNVIGVPGSNHLLVTVGSNSNVAENGMDKEVMRAAILKINTTSGDTQIFASGLRNPNGLAWQPETGKLWTTVNERDELGDNLVPDYMTSVSEHAFFGWPYSYYGQHLDKRVKTRRPDLVATAVVPDYALGAHTASLGLAFYDADLLPRRYRYGAFIGQHGSWNRHSHSGYKVIFVPFENGEPQGLPKDILTGFLSDRGEAKGRPAGVAIAKDGAVLVADDVGNTIWRIAPGNESANDPNARE